MDVNVALPAALIADPTRAAILMALMDGRAQPATALAYAAGVSSQAASNHLAKLMQGGLLAVETEGRHRYYRLARPEVASVLEGLAGLAPRVRSLDEPRSPQGRALRLARSCYDHIAGRLGVAIASALEARGLLAVPDAADKAYAVTGAGRRWFADLGIDIAAIRSGPRPAARRCLDWTERRHHLAGPIGARLMERLEELGWIRRDRATRAVLVTETGFKGLREALGLDMAALQTGGRMECETGEGLRLAG